jgi:hypothetical protein
MPNDQPGMASGMPGMETAQDGMGGGRVEIDRISLRVTAMDPIDARALARAVAAGLAPTLSLAPGEASLERLRVEVQARPGDDQAAIARRAATRLAPLINRVDPTEAAR